MELLPGTNSWFLGFLEQHAVSCAFCTVTGDRISVYRHEEPVEGSLEICVEVQINEMMSTRALLKFSAGYFILLVNWAGGYLQGHTVLLFMRH